ncbi:hypothetical protein [Haliangium sp.]|uniref:hypothetical protein n=1 Tax=Haliangium sp. TaxID=2663208 RepID=UPI003D142DAD
MMSPGPAPVLAALACALSATACSVPSIVPSTAPPLVQVERLSEAPAVPLTPANTLMDITSPLDLPVGLLVGNDARDRPTLYAVPNMPSPTRPHVVIARLYVGRSSGPQGPRAALAALRRKASELGANALFRDGGDAARVAYAVYVAPAIEALESAPAPEELLVQEAGRLAEYAPTRAAQRLPLEGAQEVTLALARGRCYAAIVAFDRDAVLGQDGQRGLSVETRSNDPLMGTGGFLVTESIPGPDGIELTAPLHGRYIDLRSFTAPLGCAWEDGREAAVAIRTRAGGAVLGTGHYWLQILEREISDVELEQRRKDRDAATRDGVQR